ncbi:ABC transporter substrate-binding protein [Micromonospora sp. NBC_01796]|uniref:ABC transporter substrate-binding protein n=1 Tax=Micromonospora sp. NBC_01796 TaxID=2975987 RepID=UPI002DD84D32|nr:ABC transporter substrate-binding protein [Micromonospora sp. NBC_01796]WSA85407.1 ABC transporter substrate-binding protein [Micromonospora sp. NBC_01796]
MRRLMVSAIAATLILGVAACGSTEDTGDDGGSAGPDRVKVGAIPIVDVAPLYLGEEKGFFRDQGIELEVVNTTGGAAAVPGVVSGEFDFAFGNVVSLILARSQRLPLKAIAVGNSSTGKADADFGGIVVPAGSPIQTAADLAGRTVAVNNLKNVGDTTVRASIRKAGGDATKVKFVELPFPDMPAAVAAKRVDAAWIVEPFFTVARNEGARVVASNFVDTAPNMTVAAYFTSENVVKERADLTRRFTAAIETSLKYAQEHPDEARKVLLSYTKIEAAVTEQITLPAWPTEINRESVQVMADLMLTDGLIKEKVDISELLP